MDALSRQGCIVGMVVVLLVFGGGCESSKKIRVNDQVNVIAYKPDVRGGYVIRHEDGKHMILSEPSPDVAREYQASIKAAAGVIDKIENVEAKVDYSTQVVDLAKRSQTLQILREALFRLSELVANGAVTPGESKALYDRALRAVEMIALVELGNSGLPEESQRAVVESFYGKVRSGHTTDTKKEENK